MQISKVRSTTTVNNSKLGWAKRHLNKYNFIQQSIPGVAKSKKERQTHT